MVTTNSSLLTVVIPDKHYFTIGEVSILCDVKPHVLRYWEQEFPSLRPNKRRGNRRYYTRSDVQLVIQIYHLLYEKGFTIQGARVQLRANRHDKQPAHQVTSLAEILVELQGIQDLLDQ